MKRLRILTRAFRAGSLPTLAVIATAVSLAAPAVAYFSSTGNGRASAAVGKLNAPTITSASAGAGTVALQWSSIVPPGAGSVTYYVTRNGGAPSSGCPSSASQSSATSCTDTGLSKGTYNYTVTAVWKSWTATSSPATSVSVAFGAPAELVFVQQPDGSPTGGVAFPQQPHVAVEDAGGNVVTTDTSNVTLSITSGTGTSGASLTCTTDPLAASSGVASFAGCKIDKAGTNYQLHAADGALTAADSAQFNVAMGPATQLVFTQQPDGSATAGNAFPAQPVVTAEDAGGNTVTGYTKPITLSIKSGTGTTGASLTCTTNPLAASSGVASFAGCKINDGGTGYVLTAGDGTLSTNSAAFNVSNVLATSVAEAAGPASTVATTSISPVNGSTYLIFVYCSGQSSGCNSTTAKASVSSSAFTTGSATFQDAVGTGTSKDCLEVFTATGSPTSGAVTVTGATGQNIGFVNVVQLSPGAQVQNGTSLPTAHGSSSPATASLTSPPSNFGELVPVAIADGNGGTSISVQTPASGMNLLGSAQQSATIGADMSVYFDSTAQTSASFALNPTSPVNGWATYAIEVG